MKYYAIIGSTCHQLGECENRIAATNKAHKIALDTTTKGLGQNIVVYDDKEAFKVFRGLKKVWESK